MIIRRYGKVGPLETSEREREETKKTLTWIKEEETNLWVIFYPDRKWSILIRGIIGISMEEVGNHRIESSFCNFVSKFPVSQNKQKPKQVTTGYLFRVIEKKKKKVSKRSYIISDLEASTRRQN